MNREFVFGTVIGPIAILALGIGGLVWPNYRSAAAASNEIKRLQGMHDSTEQLTADLDKIVKDHTRLKTQIDETMKDIPDSPDVASLMRKLSFNVDDFSVRDQTLTAGAEGEAVQGVPTSEKALPLTVQMQANFDSIFALIRIAESMDRLVRVTSIHVHSEEEDEMAAMRGLLNATIVLEAIYDSGEMPGDASE